MANPNLSQLPDEIGKLQNLEELVLDGSFETLPEECGNLSKLKILNIAENDNLLSLPDSLGNLKALETIICKQNQLHLLPASLVQCPGLQSIETPMARSSWYKANNIPLADFLMKARNPPQKQS